MHRPPTCPVGTGRANASDLAKSSDAEFQHLTRRRPSIGRVRSDQQWVRIQIRCCKHAAGDRHGVAVAKFPMSLPIRDDLCDDGFKSLRVRPNARPVLAHRSRNQVVQALVLHETVLMEPLDLLQHGLQSHGGRAGAASGTDCRNDHLLKQFPDYSFFDRLLRAKKPIAVCRRHRDFVSDVGYGRLPVTEPPIQSLSNFQNSTARS